MTTYKTTEIYNMDKVTFLIKSATANEELGKTVIGGLKKLKRKKVVKYKYAKDYPSGRQVSTSYSLSYMPNRVRGFITEGYKDYDIVNIKAQWKNFDAEFYHLEEMQQLSDFPHINQSIQLNVNN